MSHRIVVLLALAILINYVDRGNLAVAAPILTHELALTNSQFGVLLSAFFWTYAPAQILGGWLSDRFDTRVVLAGGLTLWSIATGLTGLAQGFTTLLLLRVLLGLGECVTFPSCVRLLAQHTPEHVRGSANGILAAGQALGPTLGTLLGGLLMARFGWRAVFIGSGVGSLLWLWPWTAFGACPWRLPGVDRSRRPSLGGGVWPPDSADRARPVGGRRTGTDREGLSSVTGEPLRDGRAPRR